MGSPLQTTLSQIATNSGVNPLAVGGKLSGDNCWIRLADLIP